MCNNNKYRLAGYQAIRDTAIKELHYLTVAQRKYEKEQATNPFLSGLTYQLPTSPWTNLR
ncbi:hypothetical protein ACP193_00095 (plasmid) [Spiroplasma endosymbiont of Glossina fuscipes fuscipes]